MLQVFFSIIFTLTKGLRVENEEKAFAGTGKRCAVYVTSALIGRSVFYTFFRSVFSIFYPPIGNNLNTRFPLGDLPVTTPFYAGKYPFSILSTINHLNIIGHFGKLISVP